MRALKLAAVLLTALALVPTGAHLFELPNKIGLPEPQYFVVQGIYRGWALFGVVLIAAVLVDLLLGLALWRRGQPAWAAFTAGLLVAVTLGVFFAWTQPANAATANWTTMPADWRQLRGQWEYSHAANAVLTFAALLFVTLAAIGPRDPGRSGADRIPRDRPASARR
jgi:hypothetical protein